MAEEFESFEIEVSEEDILYYIEDEDGNQVGFAVMEDGEEVEYFFDGDADDYEIVGDDEDDEVLELLRRQGLGEVVALDHVAAHAL